ncbi:MAG: hypothetical protein ACKOE7_08590, partial [Actinomycetota bacterium]
MERFSEVVESVAGAGLTRHHIGVGDDNGAVGTEFGNQTTQPRCTMPKIAVVVHDMVRGVGEKLHHRLVG